MMMKSIKLTLIMLLVGILLIGVCLPSYAEEYDGDSYLPEAIRIIADGGDLTLGEINDYDRYERAYEIAGISPAPDCSIAFQSGGTDHSHQYICAQALRILANDKGDCIFFTSENSTKMCEGADWPDSYDMGALFNTHFYNPYTETSYGGGSTTAKVKAKDYYDKAVTYYKNGDISSAIDEIGRGAHFVSDACEAHHATNKTAVNSNHSSYEKYIDTVRTDAVFPNNTLHTSVYEEALICSVGQLVRNNSYASYSLGSKVTGSSSNPDYRDAARATMMNAIISNVQYFYKFAVEVGIY